MFSFGVAEWSELWRGVRRAFDLVSITTRSARDTLSFVLEIGSRKVYNYSTCAFFCVNLVLIVIDNFFITMKDSFYRTPVIIVAVGLVGLALLMMGSGGKKERVGGDLLDIAPVAYEAHTKGSPTAAVVLVEYGDFQCPACKAYAPATKKMIEKYGSQVRFEFRHFPLPMHPNAIPAARAAEAASAQGKFWEMHDKLYENQESWANLGDPKDTFAGYAAELGLDMVKYGADYAAEELAGRVVADMNEGKAKRVDYTPYFLMNGQRIENPSNEEAFAKMIEDALVVAGTPYVPVSTEPAPISAQ